MIGSMTRREAIDDAPNQQPAESSPATETHVTRRPWFLALVLVVVTFVAYQPAWHAGFIWDDDDHLTANPAMTAPHGLKMIWSSLAVSRYYPLTLTTFWFQRRLWELNPMPYHLVNIALHAANGSLIFLALRRLRIPLPWLAAMLWVLHPVNVESVAWITELKNTQSGLFFFLSILSFLRFETDRKPGWYGLAIACGLAAMLSKPSTVVLPFVLLLCAWWQRGRWNRADMMRIAPFFALAVGMSALTVIEQRAHVLRAGATDWQLGPAERLVIAGKDIWFYAAKVFWPVRLTFVYPRWEVDASSVGSWAPTASLVALGVALWRWRSRPWCRAALYGGGFFVVALLPVLGFFDVFYFWYSFVADHFQYLACLGLISLAVSAGAAICERAGQRGRAWGTLVAGFVLLLLGVSTWRQARVYQDVDTLWRDTLAKNPQCWMAHNNLGLELSKLGQTQAAIGQYEDAVRIKPDLAEAHNNLGNALSALGQTTEAVAQYQETLRIKPGYAGAHRNLGCSLLRLGRAQDAIGPLEEALRIQPEDALAHARLGLALSQVGRVSEALGQYEQALRLQPDLVEAQNNLAWQLATLPPAQGGDPVRAIRLAERACQLSANKSAEYTDTLATAYAAAGKFEDAIATAQNAIDLARSTGQAGLAKEIEARLELYRSGRAYTQSTEATGPNRP